ncbi:MAG: hypothetical protein R3182_12860 [Draconibacterium sp.]|nr:hypothetical protein [Draconibacterium sp.]
MRILLLILFVLCFVSGRSQNYEYQVLFEGIGDNREFTKPLAYPQTILGSRGSFEVGVTSDNHKLRGGISELFEFGSDIDFHKPKLIMYYQFDDEQKEFMFGSFPRRNKIDFPLAMLSDTLLYYRPNIEGFFAEVNWNWGKQNGFVDWVGLQTQEQREQFMAGLSGEIFKNNLFLQNYFLLFHNAHTKYNLPKLHIKDYFGYALQAGIRTSESSQLQGDIKGGILTSMYRERSVTDGFVNSSSVFFELNGRYKNFGIKSVLSSGDGHNFNFGDNFYKAENYWRTDVIWYFINHTNVKGKFNISLHAVNWDYLDQQQQLSIIYIFGK